MVVMTIFLHISYRYLPPQIQQGVALQNGTGSGPVEQLATNVSNLHTILLVIMKLKINECVDIYYNYMRLHNAHAHA